RRAYPGPPRRRTHDDDSDPWSVSWGGTPAGTVRPVGLEFPHIPLNAGALHDFTPAVGGPVDQAGRRDRATRTSAERTRRAPETRAIRRNVPRGPSRVLAMSRSSGRMISRTPPTSPTLQSRLVLFGSWS